jgi:GxxExxY protein
MIELLLKDEVYVIIGTAMEVHNVLGCGFLEAVYQETLEIEFRKQNIPFTSQSQLPIKYKDHLLKKTYVADFICFTKIVIEIKAINHLSSLEEAQLLNYMKAGNYELGLLINFGAESLQWKRMVHSKKKAISEIREISG